MIVAGYTYYDTSLTHLQVVIVGRGDRAHVDALVAAAPEKLRPQIVEYFKPFAESSKPDRPGWYIYSMTGVYPKMSNVWWKPVNEVLP